MSNEISPQAPEMDTTAKEDIAANLPAPAKRALKEAKERRLAQKENEQSKEIGGRGGKDPARFGDWEVKGIAVDF